MRRVTETQTPWVMTKQRLDEVVQADLSRARRTAWLFGGAFFLAAAGLAGSALRLDRSAYGVPVASMFIVAAFLLVAEVAVPTMVFSMQRARRRRWERRERECAELMAIAATIEDDPALGDLLTFNFRLMDRFVAVAIAQSRGSFLACTAAASAGLLVLLAGSAAVLSVPDMTGQIVAGVLTGAGSALSAYLSVTFLNTFRMTSKQMSYYYGQPLVHCYLLHAEWLGKRFEQDADPENRWKIRHALIQATLDAARNAQNNLLDLQIGNLSAPAPVSPFATLTGSR